MELEELSSALNPRVLVLPIDGVRYEVKDLDATGWLELEVIDARVRDRRLTDPGAAVEGVTDEQELRKLVLGDAYHQMLENKVPGRFLRKAYLTAYFWQLQRDEVAAQMWADGGDESDPEAEAAPDQPTPQQETLSIESPSTDGESKTP
jgi:hypothetical protein